MNSIRCSTTIPSAGDIRSRCVHGHLSGPRQRRWIMHHLYLECLLRQHYRNCYNALLQPPEPASLHFAGSEMTVRVRFSATKRWNISGTVTAPAVRERRFAKEPPPVQARRRRHQDFTNSRVMEPRDPRGVSRPAPADHLHVAHGDGVVRRRSRVGARVTRSASGHRRDRQRYAVLDPSREGSARELNSPLCWLFQSIGQRC
jgi:hypothetical protein